MTDTTLPTEPLRAEHRELLPHLQGLETVADEVDRWDADEAAHVLGDIVGFLRGNLAPTPRPRSRCSIRRSRRRWPPPGPRPPCAPTTPRSSPDRPPGRHGGHCGGSVARQRRDPRRDPPARGAGSHPAAALPQGGGGPATAFAVLVGRRARCESERASPRNIRRANTFLCCPTTESFCRTERIARAEHTFSVPVATPR